MYYIQNITTLIITMFAKKKPVSDPARGYQWSEVRNYGAISQLVSMQKVNLPKNVELLFVLKRHRVFLRCNEQTRGQPQ